MKFVFLTERSLDRVWAWYEANKDTPLGGAYGSACASVTTAMELDEAEESQRFSYRLVELSLIYRDTIGREILRRMRTTKK